MAETLTEQQRAAVTDRGGKLLVSAAAGSGKTKVLVDRLMCYVLDPIDPSNVDDFLIITYTKAAAAELRGKIAKRISELIAEYPDNRHLQQQTQRLYLAKISTVHSFCGDILREYAYRLDLAADFRVADEIECNELKYAAIEHILQNAYDTAADDPDFCGFIDTQGLGRDDRLIPEIILKTYNSAICHLSPKQWLEDCLSAVNVTNLAGAEQTVWGKYLMDDLRFCIQLHTEALQNCMDAAIRADGFEKPVQNLEHTLLQLKQLSGFGTWDEIVSFGKLDFGRLTFSKKITDLQLIDQIKAVRNACKKALERKLSAFSNCSEQVLEDLQKSAQASRGLIDLVFAFMERYGKLKSQRRVVDFSDLEHKTLDLLLGVSRSGVTVAASEIAKRFREIMVDEYQDSNSVQDAIFSVLTEKNQNCFMVGDVKQSIYQFRLADPSIFVDKYNAYKHAAFAEPGQGRKILLSNNFRSSDGVISAVNDVFSKCMNTCVGGLDYGPDEMLYEGIPHVPIDEPEVELHTIQVRQDTYAEEAAFTAEKILSLTDGSHFVRDGEVLRPIVASDIVILLRSPGSVGREYQYALEQRGIACVTGGNGDLLNQPEIATLKSILQVIDNPLQDIPLAAAMVSPVFCFTADDLARLRCRNKKISLFHSVLNARTDKVCRFVDRINMLRNDARMDSVAELIQHIFERTNYLQIYGAMPDGQQRQENIQTFCQLVSDYQSGGRTDLPGFLRYLNGLEELGVISNAATESSGGVTIMSIHKSKGLEFPVVFLCGLSRRFNEESVRAQVLCHKDLGLGLSCVELKKRLRYPTIAKRAIASKILSEGLSEELRVLYVAMTRARDRLIMTYAAKDLEADLQDISMRLEHSPNVLLTSGATCPGDWILLSAMTRTEAGTLFALGGNPGMSSGTGRAWKITVDQAPEEITSTAGEAVIDTSIDPALVAKIQNGLSYRYDYLSATQIPSKQTATQLKGRLKDQEVADGNLNTIQHSFRSVHSKPSVLRGKEYGTVMHLVMQHIHYPSCTDVAGVYNEIQRLVAERILTEAQAQAVACEQIAAFFQSSLGAKVLRSDNILREFKFSVLMRTDKYYPNANEDEILLQGVVDLAVIDEEIILIDFKTDNVTLDTVDYVAQGYFAQVSAYADALEEVFEKSVCKSFLYFFKLNKSVEVQR